MNKKNSTTRKLPKIINDIISSGISAIVIKMRMLILAPIIIKSAGIDAFGAWVQGTNAAMLFAIIAIGGMRDALVRYYHEYREEGRQAELLFHAMTIAFLLAIPMAAVIFLFSSELSILFLQSDRYHLMFRWTAVLLVSVSFYNILLNYLRSQDRINLFNIIDTVQKWAELGVLILLLMFRKNVVLLIQGSIATYLIAIAGLIIVLSKDISLKGFKIRSATSKKLLRYSMPLLPAQFSIHIADRGDRFLVGYYLGAEAVGVYSICYVIANVITLFSLPLVTALPSKLARMWDNEEYDRVFVITGILTRWLSAVSIAAFVIVYSLGEDAIALLTGFKKIDSVKWILFWIGAGVIMFSISRAMNIIQLVNKNTKMLGNLWIVTNIINLSSNVILIPRFGILGAAFATMISYLFIFVVSMILISKQINRFFPLGFYLKLILSVSALWITVRFITVTSLYGLFFSAAAGCLVFIISFLMLRPFISEDEKRFLDRIPLPYVTHYMKGCDK